MALLDTGSRVSVLTKGFVEAHDIPLKPMSDLTPAHPYYQVVINGVAGMSAPPLGYAEIYLEDLKGVKGFSDWDLALVVRDDTPWGKRVPLILGTACLERMIKVIKESEEEKLPPPLDMVKNVMDLTDDLDPIQLDEAELYSVTNRVMDVRDLDEIVTLKSDCTIPPGDMVKTKGITPILFRSHRANVMVTRLEQPPANWDSNLIVMNTYCTVACGSKSVAVAITNHSNKPITVRKGVPLGRMQLATEVEPRVMAAGVIQESLDNEMGVTTQDPAPEGESVSPEAPPAHTLTTEERKEKLLEEMDLSGLSVETPEFREKAIELLKEFHDIFSLDAMELGTTEVTKHVIRVSDPVPFKERFRRIPPPLLDEVKSHLSEMLDAGVIIPSKSPWSNAVVLVRKKDKGLRFCIDFRRLNARTIKDSYALPRIDEALDSLQGAQYFSSLDLKSGFWQIPMAGESQEKTAFTVGNLGFYQFTRMPFGLTNAPATFQRAMEQCLGDMNLVECLIYLDDVIVFSTTVEEHLVRLRRAFERIRAHNLKLKPSKCELFRRRLKYVGHIVDEEGIHPDPGLVQDVLDTPPPQNYTEIRQFLGMAGYYRRFIQGYCKVVQPLNDLLKGENSQKKTEQVTLGEEALQAFENLKKALTTAPVLAMTDFNKPFLLETDASGSGLGAVLSQKGEDGRFHPVAYASRTLKPAERRYHSSKLEFLALYWAVTKQFAGHLQHVKEFECRTDNNPLTYVLTTAKLDAAGHRWVADLMRFNFSLHYQKGSNNTVADALSRNPSPNNRNSGVFSADEVKAALSGAEYGATERAEVYTTDVIVRAHVLDRMVAANSLPMRAKLPLHTVDWAQAQREDPELAAVIQWMERYYQEKSGNIEPQNPGKAHTRKGRLGFAQVLSHLPDNPHKKEWSACRYDFRLKNHLLYKVYQPPGDANAVECFVVPQAHRTAAMDGCHRDSGHQGRDRTLSLLRERFWWPGMRKQILEKIKSCTRCQAHHAKLQKAELRPIVVTAPLELVHVDFTSAENTMDLKAQPKAHNILVIQDHFTKYVVAQVTPDQKATTVARYLWESFFSVFGPPARLISDQGANFTSELVQELCKLLNVQKVRTTAYHAQGNGQVERIHQTLFKMIGSLDPEEKEDWPRQLKALTFAYNSTRSAVTGYSPYYLMFGMRPRIPVDFMFPTRRTGDIRASSRPVDEYVATLQGRLRSAFDDARSNAAREAARQKIQYDRKIGSSVLEAGDKVLVRQDAARGKRKLKDRWGTDVLSVLERVDDTPLYRVQLPNGKSQLMHRNRLLFLTRGDLGGEPLVVAKLTADSIALTKSSCLNEAVEQLTESGTLDGISASGVAASGEGDQKAGWMTGLGDFLQGVLGKISSRKAQPSKMDVQEIPSRLVDQKDSPEGDTIARDRVT